MLRRTGQAPLSDQPQRETRIKVPLLLLAFVLVAGYASALTELSDMMAERFAAVRQFQVSLVVQILAAAALVLLGSWWLLTRLRREVHVAPAHVPFEQLPVRRDFVAHLGQQLAAHAENHRQLAVHVLDIDRFSAVNHILGEAEGDALLRRIAEQLSVLVGHPSRLAHIGDDEFAILQPEVGGVRHAELYARRIADALKDPFAHLPRHCRAGASVGSAVSQGDDLDAAALLQSASMALRSAKQTDGDGLQVFSRELRQSLEARLQLERAISEGLHEGWFCLRYQPQYDLRSGRLTGFEALARLQHPQLGELLPETFLAVAEETSLIQPIGDALQQAALAVAAGWPQDLALSLNVSPVQLRQADFATKLLGTMAKAGLQNSRVRVEISERMLVGRSAAQLEQIASLRSQGVLVILDDFGVDRSSLRALSERLCDGVKLDRSLVQPAAESAEASQLVNDLIATARVFGLAVMAEGVERAEQAAFLVSNGCYDVQGSLFGTPAQEGELQGLIARNSRSPQPAASQGRSQAAFAGSMPRDHPSSSAFKRMSR